MTISYLNNLLHTFFLSLSVIRYCLLYDCRKAVKTGVANIAPLNFQEQLALANCAPPTGGSGVILATEIIRF